MFKRLTANMPSRTGPRSTRWVGLWSVLIALWVTTPPPGAAFSTDLEGDALLKSTYILNFAKLVEWPEVQGQEESSRFGIGICGDPYLWRACRRELAGEKIHGSRVALTPLSVEKATQNSSDIKVLFVYTDDEVELKALIAALADRPVLLISDYPGFCDLGGSIGLLWEKDRMLFEINRRQESRAGYKFNSRLLRVARRVLE